jgi:hypothetical protein
MNLGSKSYNRFLWYFCAFFWYFSWSFIKYFHPKRFDQQCKSDTPPHTHTPRVKTCAEWHQFFSSRSLRSHFVSFDSMLSEKRLSYCCLGCFICHSTPYVCVKLNRRIFSAPTFRTDVTIPYSSPSKLFWKDFNFLGTVYVHVLEVCTIL